MMTHRLMVNQYLLIAQLNFQIIMLEFQKIFKYDKDKFLTILEDVGDNSLINKKNFYQDDSPYFRCIGAFK